MPYVQARSINRTPDELVEAIADVESSPLGRALLEALSLAEDIDLAASRKRSGLQRAFQHIPPQTAIERLAEALLNAMGPPEDCWGIRQAAETALEAQREAEKAMQP